MHRHRKVWPLVQGSYFQCCSAATAARIKPRTLDAEPKHTNLGKWAPPVINRASPSSSAPLSEHTGNIFQREPSQSEPEPEHGLFKPVHSPYPPSIISPTHSEKWDRQDKFRIIPPRPGNIPYDSETRSLPPPLSIKPQSSGTPGKWARRTPLTLQKDQSIKPPHATIARSDSRTHLRRNLPPHQHPPKDYSSHQLPHPSGHQELHKDKKLFTHSQNLQKRTFDSPNLLDMAISSPPIYPRSDQEVSPDNSSNNSRNERSSLRNMRERSHRNSYKERGSLLPKLNEEVNHSTSFVLAQKKDKDKIKKSKVLEKRAAADVYIPSTVSVGTLARLLGVRLERLQDQMRRAGMAEEAKYDHVLTSDYASLLTEEFGRNPIVNDEAAFDIYPPPPHPDPSLLRSRPPIVTIMGHVDHGKTTLLDSLRSASVAKGEAGGITQHIGAFSVPVPTANSSVDSPRSITFLDTPGHAAFSAMRARGARVTDIVVLVVAADDGIMPQTKEVISLIKKDEGRVGVVVAINKVDKHGVNIDAVQKALMAENLQLEVFGGDIPSVEVSGLTGYGLPALVETISAMAEMQDLRAEQEGLVQGYVLESKIHKGLGPIATVLILRGCLKLGSHILSGVSQAKVRVMSDFTGAAVKVAHPGMAITVSGWKTLPNVGDEVLQGTEGEVKKAIANRHRKAETKATLVDIEAINSNRRQERERRNIELERDNLDRTSLRQDDETGPKELRLIIKADVSGSAEAVEGALQGIGNKEAITRIVSSGVGDISESDVMMAKAVGATIVGFSVSVSRAVGTLAAQNDVPICSSNIIYRLMDDIKDRVIALLPVIFETRVTGEAIVLQLFDIQLKAKQTKKVAGCRVTNGIIEKTKFARLVRSGDVIHDGTLDTMRILKKDVIEVRKGSECGLCFGTTFADIREGDIIQMFERLEKPGAL